MNQVHRSRPTLCPILWINHGRKERLWWCAALKRPFFSDRNFTVKTAGLSGIRTRIVRVEGEHADHLTATTAPPYLKLKEQNKFSFKLFHKTWDRSSVAFNQCDQIWCNFATLAKFNNCLAKFLNVYLEFGKFFTLFWQNLMLLGKFAMFLMAKYWKVIHSSGHIASNRH